jgi:hypothetical protein
MDLRLQEGLGYRLQESRCARRIVSPADLKEATRKLATQHAR